MNIESVHLCLLAVIYTIYYQPSVKIYWCLSAGAKVTFLSFFLFKSNMLFTLLLILWSNQQFYLNLIIHSHLSKALCCQPTLCLDMVSHLTPCRPELYMGRGKCSLTTPSLSRALPSMAKWPCPQPANATQMCRLQACTLTSSFGARRQIASHWLRVLVN